MDPQWGNTWAKWSTYLKGDLMLFKLLKSAKFYPGIPQETIYMGW